MKNYSEVYRAQHIDLVTRRNHVKGVRRKDILSLRQIDNHF